MENITSFNLSEHMPWIGAIIIGLLTVIVNLIISKESRKTTIEITEKLLTTSKELAIVHIENERKNAQMEFNKSVLSGNRQAWIKDLRELISRLISNIMAITLKQQLSKEDYENLRFQIIKAELMLNSEKDIEFIKELRNLENCCLEILMGNSELFEIEMYSDNVRKFAQSTLKTEWERVKKGD